MTQQTTQSHFNSGFVYRKLLLWEMKQIALIAGIEETNNLRSLLSQINCDSVLNQDKVKYLTPRLPA